MTRTAILATLLIATAGASVAEAAPYKHGRDRHAARITPHERIVIRRSQARLNALRRRAWADGRVNFFERMRIKFAMAKHRRLVRKERRD